ncbi:MAG: phage tail protein [Pontixanthobacter sp.]
MATLVLGAFGTLVGGPIGGAIGALAGRQIDSAIIGNGSREGPRLKELAFTTSSYGTPIARHFGRMRVAGTIIWATELAETTETGGGGKGQPKTTSYSYSSSFAVALCARPIAGVGRIWADGNLLRGAAGDLKVGGAMRIHRGFGDQAPDPLIASDLGADAAPAFRGTAYVVFEDLQLGDFGNRIPALTFELVADDHAPGLPDMLEDLPVPVMATPRLDGLAGFSHEGGPIADSLGVLDTLYPLTIDPRGPMLTLRDGDGGDRAPAVLPPSNLVTDDADFGVQDGQRRERRAYGDTALRAIRYYDVARDYQPGLQHASGRAPQNGAATLQFPGAMDVAQAVRLLGRAAIRARHAADRLLWRMSAVDAAFMPGADVLLPPNIDTPGSGTQGGGTQGGIWRVEEWEWRETGVELTLRRLPPGPLALPPNAAPPVDSGGWLPAPDDIAGPTILTAFELPWDGTGSTGERRVYAAAGSTSRIWRGAPLYRDTPGGLVALASLPRTQAAIGRLAEPLPGAMAVLFDPNATLELALETAHPGFRDASPKDIAMGANRLLIGREIVQFAQARQRTDTRWTLRGLLRGRGGTEAAAIDGHGAQTRFTLIDDTLVPLDTANLPVGGADTLAAIGFADDAPVITTIDNTGRTLRPLSPVHGRATRTGGTVAFTWVRRARGAWLWLDRVDAPLNEEVESYAVGIGDADQGRTLFETNEPRIDLPADALNAGPVWVRQIGRFGTSPPLVIALP